MSRLVEVVDTVEEFKAMHRAHGDAIDYTTEQVVRVYGREFRSSDVVVAMLRAQVRVVCDCGLLCNFGKSPKKASRAGQRKFYVNCGEFRGRKYEYGDDGGCNFVVVVQLKEDFWWKHSPAREDDDGTVPPSPDAQTEESEPAPAKKARVVDASAASRARCARCGLEQAGGVLVSEEALVGLSCTQRAELEDVVAHMLGAYFKK